MKSFYKKYHRAKVSFWNAVATEWNAIKLDKALISTFLSVAFVILIVYTYLYSREVITEVPVAIVNQDESKTSRDYISMLNASKGIYTKTNYTDLKAAEEDYYENIVKGIVVIPKDFGKDLRRGRQTTISTYADASNMLFYKEILGDVTVTTGYFNAGIAIKKEMAKGNSMAQAKANYSPVQAVTTSLFNVSSGYATYLIPVLTALIVQLVLLMGIGIINGTRHEDNKMLSNFPRLLHKGGTIPVLLGKSFVYTSLFSIILPLQIGIVYSLFSIPVRSSIWMVYLFSLPYLLAIVFFGIAISSLFKRREDSIVFIVLTSIPSLMLSGLSFPIETFPKFYQYFTQIIPSTPGINGFVKLTQMEATISEVSPEWNHLWVLALVYFIIATVTLKLQSIKERKISTK
ncbi:ABC transporter permease [Formosa sp. PL04]|uniref:ABC transporter permease n=1 Tax=Formosa sp. PL04 TaxID=3081755 RepID=UPI002981C5FE|nr:ABC transporter permease [Formosa sp. PL04]MDW5290257.1 ABC transporter permease [Formosa sp. PL04]